MFPLQIPLHFTLSEGWRWNNDEQHDPRLCTFDLKVDLRGIELFALSDIVAIDTETLPDFIINGILSSNGRHSNSNLIPFRFECIHFYLPFGGFLWIDGMKN